MTSHSDPSRSPEVPEVLKNALLNGARTRRLDQVERALELGADPNAWDSFGLSAMHMAATHGDVRMIQVLMRYGAEPFTTKAISPFFSAVISGRLDVLRLLASHQLDLETSDVTGRSALEMALISGKYDVASWLAENGADLHPQQQGRTLLGKVIDAKNNQAVELMLEMGVRISAQTATLAKSLDPALAAKVAKVYQRQQMQLAGVSGNAAQDNSRPDSDQTESSDVDMPTQSSAMSRLFSIAGGAHRRLMYGLGRCVEFAAGLPDMPRRKRMINNTAALQKSMHDLLPHVATKILASKDIDIEAIDERGHNLLQQWCLMIDKLLVPRTGKCFEDDSSRDQQACLDLLQHLSRKIGQRRDILFARFAVSGNTVLHELILKGHACIAMHLLRLDAMRALVNTANSDLDRPAHLAVKAEDPKLLASLGAAGANLNAYNHKGYTPMHISALTMDLVCAESCIALGANIRLKTKAGLTLDEMTDGRGEAGEWFRALLIARRAIESAKSIFSSGHPLADATRSRMGVGISRLTKPSQNGVLGPTFCSKPTEGDRP